MQLLVLLSEVLRLVVGGRRWWREEEEVSECHERKFGGR
jgi:hypothetical protein